MDNLHLSGRYYLPADALVRRRINASSRTFETRGCEIIPPMLVGLGLALVGPDGQALWQHESLRSKQRAAQNLRARSGG